jgi:hypothetical protein
MLSKQDKINYQTEEKKITQRFRQRLLTPAEYCKELQELNKKYMSMGDMTIQEITQTVKELWY